MQSELRVHVVRIAEDPFGQLRRVHNGLDSTRLIYQYRSEWADGVSVLVAFEFREEELLLIGIQTQFDPPRDEG